MSTETCLSHNLNIFTVYVKQNEYISFMASNTVFLMTVEARLQIVSIKLSRNGKCYLNFSHSKYSKFQMPNKEKKSAYYKLYSSFSKPGRKNHTQKNRFNGELGTFIKLNQTPVDIIQTKLQSWKKKKKEKKTDTTSYARRRAISSSHAVAKNNAPQRAGLLCSHYSQ